MQYPIRHCLVALLLLSGLIAAPDTARAAESYDNCTGFIDSLPATISTQGVWCLRQHLSTSISSGNVIEIATNNVIIDCNDFKLGGLAGGMGTQAIGVFAQDRSNATVRNCNIRGFWVGLYLLGANGGGHRVESNRFDGNTYAGAAVSGRGSVVRDNQFVDTGGSTVIFDAYAIFDQDGGTDILDNVVDGVAATTGGNGWAVGIHSNANSLSATISGNRVRNLAADGTGEAYGIRRTGGSFAVITRNVLIGSGTGEGIQCDQINIDGAKDNVVLNFVSGIGSCADDGGNVVRNAL